LDRFLALVKISLSSSIRFLEKKINHREWLNLKVCLLTEQTDRFLFSNNQLLPILQTEKLSNQSKQQEKMKIGIIGLNHKTGSLKLRESLAKASERCFSLTRPSQHAFVLLSTCNRTEIYFHSSCLSSTHSYILALLREEMEEEEFDQKLYSWFDKDCFLHLALVTSGLDSAIVGETEIQHQVKEAYAQAQKEGPLPHELHYLFQKSLKIGKESRGLFSPQSHLAMPDLKQAILNAGMKEDLPPHRSRLLFVGASSINNEMIPWFKKRGFKEIALSNRSNDKGSAMADKYSLAYLPWEELECWREFDWVVFSTKAKQALLSSRDMQEVTLRKRLIFDLSVPRNVDPALHGVKGIRLFNIDELQQSLAGRKEKMARELEFAETFILHAIERSFGLFKRGLYRSELTPTAVY